MKQKRIFYMDFVRTVATLLIIILHFNISTGMREMSDYSILKNDFANGGLVIFALPMFFILSGMGLMISNSESFDVKKYYIKRFRAIYPLFWTAYIIVVFYYFFQYKTIHPWGAVPRKWTLILSVLGMDGYTSCFVQNYYYIGEWFLGCIILLYLIFPLLRIGVEKRPKTCWISVVIVYIAILLLYEHNNYQYKMLIDMVFLMRVPEFLLGMYIGKYVDRISAPVFGVSLIGVIAAIFLPINGIPQMIKITVFGSCAFFVTAYIGQYIKAKGIRAIVSWFSKYSFAVYLVHHVVSEQIIQTFYGKHLSRVELYMLFVLILCADVAVGVGLFKLCHKVQSTIRQLRNREDV